MGVNYNAGMSQTLIEEIQKKISEVDKEDRFVEYFISDINIESMKGVQSKARYFWIERMIIFLSTLSGTLMTCINALNISNGMVYGIITVVIIVSSYGIVGLTAYRSLRNYYETWQRHTNYVNKSIQESTKYLNNDGEYSSLERTVALNKYKERMINLRDRTNQEFEHNMRP